MSCITTIDWAATGTMLQGVGTVVGALAVIGAAIIGSRTFDNWKRQKLAERHIEQAERILTATYKVRRGLSYVRNPAMWGHETDAAEEQLKANGEWEKKPFRRANGKALLRGRHITIVLTLHATTSGRLRNASPWLVPSLVRNWKRPSRSSITNSGASKSMWMLTTKIRQVPTPRFGGRSKAPYGRAGLRLRRTRSISSLPHR